MECPSAKPDEEDYSASAPQPVQWNLSSAKRESPSTVAMFLSAKARFVWVIHPQSASLILVEAAKRSG